MRSILATIALEPRRWVRPRIPAMTLHYLLPHIAAAGITQVEAWQWHVSRLDLEDAALVRKTADELGITFPYIGVYPSFHLPDGPDAVAARAERFGLIERARILGCSRFKIMLGMRKASEITEEEMARHNERFAEWYGACTAVGIRLVTELHGGTLFDPWEKGAEWMAAHPEFDMGICYQPYDFSDPKKALELAAVFSGKIEHIHLQSPVANGAYSLLADSPLNYAALLPAIMARNPKATMTIEFVKDCVQTGAFQLASVVQNAREDALFVEKVLS